MCRSSPPADCLKNSGGRLLPNSGYGELLSKGIDSAGSRAGGAGGGGGGGGSGGGNVVGSDVIMGGVAAPVVPLLVSPSALLRDLCEWCRVVVLVIWAGVK